MNREHVVVGLGAALVAVTASACGNEMGYRRARGWEQYRIPPMASAPTAPSIPYALQSATRFQISVCESIAGAYGARAQSRVTTNVILGLGGGLITAAGAALSGASKAVNGGVGDASTALLFTGVALTGIGAVSSATTTTLGTAESSAYSGASTLLLHSIDDFRASLRGHGPVADRAALAEQVCSLRRACLRRQIGTAPVGHDFESDVSDGATYNSRRALAAFEYLRELCDVGDEALPDIDESVCVEAMRATQPTNEQITACVSRINPPGSPSITPHQFIDRVPELN